MSTLELPLRIEGKGEVKGYVLMQVEKGDFAYVYEKNSGEGRPHYEVFKRKSSPVCIDFASRKYSKTEFKESYPRSKSFGSWAWTCGSLGDAMNKFQEINVKPKTA